MIYAIKGLNKLHFKDVELEGFEPTITYVARFTV
jgi:hypothetical protein